MTHGLRGAIFLVVTSVVRAQPSEVVSLNTEGVTLEHEGRYAAAETQFRKALELCEPNRGEPTCDQLTAVLSNLGSLYYSTGRYRDAEPLLHRAVAQWPSDAPGTNGLATALANLAAVYRAEARYAEAAPLYQRALELGELAPDRQQLPNLLNNAAQFWLDTADYPRAEQSARRALALLEARDDIESPEGAACLSTLAGVLKAQGKLEDAKTALERSLAIRKRLPGSTHTVIAETYNLARVLAEQGRWKEAEGLYREAIAGWEASLGPDHPNVAAGLTSLATLLQSRHRFDDAARLLDRARAIDEKRFPPDHPRIAYDLNNAAALASARKHYRESEELLLRAEAILENRLPAGHPELGRVLANLADIYRIEKRLEESDHTYRRALGILDAAWGPNDPRLLDWLQGYALVLRAREDYAEAAKVDQQAMRIRVAHSLRENQGSRT